MDLSGLTNAQLREELVARGAAPGPIVGTTRKVYEKKLLAFLESEGGGIIGFTSLPPPPQSQDVKRSSPTKSSPSKSPQLYPDLSRERDEYDDEVAEGEESFRLISPEEEQDLLSDRIYTSSRSRAYDNDNWGTRTRLRQPQFETPPSVSSPAYYAASPSRQSRVDGGDSAAGGMLLVKIAVGTVLAIFLFMLFRQLNIGGVSVKDDAI